MAPRTCARCGHTLTRQARAEAIYSSATGAYYCGAREDRACARRARARAKRLQEV